jgi:hypothetical protein
MQDAERIVIQETVVHPDYSLSSFRFDAMIMKLRAKSTRTYARLLNDDVGTPDDTDELTVIGFGDTEIGNGVRLPTELQETQLDYIDNEECKTMHGNWIIQEDMLCAYRDDTDSWCVLLFSDRRCVLWWSWWWWIVVENIVSDTEVNSIVCCCSYGDSGGPLLIKGVDPEDDLIVGTVSWGRNCAARGFAGVYARTSFFHDWIVQTSCSLSPDDAPFDCSNISQVTSTTDVPSSEPSAAPPSMEPTQGTADVPSSEPSAAPSMEPTQGSDTAVATSFVAWSPGRPLKQCEGDCDDDEDCDSSQGELICYQIAGMTVPGCEGQRERSIADYCIKIEDLP